MRAFPIAAVLAVLLQGCLVKSNVAVFHNLPSAKSYGTIFFAAPNDKIGQTLEFKAHTGMLAQKMAPIGFRVVDNIEHADYLGVLSYNIDSGRQEIDFHSSPVYGTTTSYVGGYAVQSYGVTGHNAFTTTRDVYTRQVGLDLFDIRDNKEKPVKVFEARATSSGRCGAVTSVLPEMIEAILQDFPGTSGDSREIIISGPPDC
jgi:hypothetical protein